MPRAADKLVTRWRRRHWQPDSENLEYKGQTPFVVVTGSSRGLGKALAIEFAQAGCAILLVARTRQTLAAAVAEIALQHDVPVEMLPLDITEKHAASQIEAYVVGLNGYVDILINNAALGLGGAFTDQSADALHRLCDLNITSLTNLTRHFLPGMLLRGRGGVLNVASLGGLVPGPYQAAYYASKAYVISLTEALAYETAGHGLKIAVLAPGPVKTDFHKSMGATNAYYLRFQGVMSAERVARVAYRGFLWGQTLIVPGLLQKFNAVALKLLPNTILAPLIGWLLHPRHDQQGKNGG